MPRSAFKFFQPAYHYILALIGAVYYGFPSRKMKVIAVTGTSGKTTLVEMLHAIFSEARYKTASLSGLRFKIQNRAEPNLLKMTMPGRFRVQKFLADARNAGCDYVFLETTSEGIKQFRHKFIKFYAAVLNNLSKEHLEAHGGFENYRDSKAKIFYLAPIHVLNAEDQYFDFFNKLPSLDKVFFHPSRFPDSIKLKLLGDFNKANAMAALAFARHEKISDETSKSALEKIITLPGRMEYINPPEGVNPKFKVLVDYAFLPQTLETLYEYTRRESPSLVCVLGAAGGGRDKWKRSVLGDIAAKYCRKIYVTNEDPYDEDPNEIIEQVSRSHNFEKILDRRVAIREALKSAAENETVVITGKGSEPWIMGPHGTKTPWDDRRVAREELENLFNSSRLD